MSPPLNLTVLLLVLDGHRDRGLETCKLHRLFGVSSCTMRTHLAKLEERGLVTGSRFGKSFVWVPTPLGLQAARQLDGTIVYERRAA